MRAFAVIVLLAGACACASYGEKPVAEKQAQAGTNGFFTYTAIDGTEVTVQRQSPDPEMSDQLVGAGVSESVK